MFPYLRSVAELREAKEAPQHNRLPCGLGHNNDRLKRDRFRDTLGQDDREARKLLTVAQHCCQSINYGIGVITDSLCFIRPTAHDNHLSEIFSTRGHRKPNNNEHARPWNPKFEPRGKNARGLREIR